MAEEATAEEVTAEEAMVEEAMEAVRASAGADTHTAVSVRSGAPRM